MKKRYILVLLIMCTLLISCSKDDDIEKNREIEENILEESKLDDYIENTRELNNIDIPKDWAYKSGMYGNYYTDFHDVILITEKNSEDKVVNYKNIIESLNFYRPDFVGIGDDIVIKNEKSNIIDGIVDSKKYLYIKIKEEDNSFISFFSENKEDLDALFKKVIR